MQVYRLENYYMLFKFILPFTIFFSQSNKRIWNNLENVDVSAEVSLHLSIHDYVLNAALIY